MAARSAAMDHTDQTLMQKVSALIPELADYLTHPSLSDVGTLSVQTVLSAMQLLCKHLQALDSCATHVPKEAIPNVHPLGHPEKMPRASAAILDIQAQSPKDPSKIGAVDGTPPQLSQLPRDHLGEAFGMTKSKRRALEKNLKIEVPERPLGRAVENPNCGQLDRNLGSAGPHAEKRNPSLDNQPSQKKLNPQALCVGGSYQLRVADVGSRRPVTHRHEEIYELTSISPSVENTTSHCYIDPNLSWRIIWDLCSMFLILMLVVVIPFETAFLWDAEPTPTTDYVVLWWINVIADAFFFIDIVLTCFTGFHEGRGSSSSMVKDPRKIMMHYAKGWLLVDLLATFPFARIVNLMGSKGDTAEMLRVLKATKAMRMLKVLRALKLGGLMQLVEESMSIAQTMAVAFQVLKLLLIILLGAHCAACAWFAVGFWGQRTGYETTWVTNAGIHTSPPGTQWVASYYFAITTGTTVGYGDISATNQIEQLFACVLLVSFVAFIGQVLTTVGHAITTYQQADAEKKMVKHHAMVFMHRRVVPQALRSKVLRYIEHVYEIDALTSFSQTGFFEKLSESLQMDLRLCIIGNFLTQFQLFAEADEAFMRAICPICRTQRAVKSDIVAQQGHANEEMYMIVRGEVTFGTTGREIGSLYANDWFGERALFFQNLVHNVTLRCETDCEFLVLRRQDFLEQMARFPEIVKEYTELVHGLTESSTSPLSLRTPRGFRTPGSGRLRSFLAMSPRAVEFGS